MSTRGSNWLDGDDGISTPDWQVDRRKCPFCEVPAMTCGCPVAERLLNETHIQRGYN